MADMNFAPTSVSYNNLIKQNVDKNTIYITGNTAIDAMKFTVNDNYENPIFEWVGNSRMILLTAHRRENLGEPMKNIFRAIKKIVDEYSDVKVVYPIHLNPNIRSLANDMLKDCDRIKIIDPLEVVDFHNFISKSYLILSDSGGVQEEAPSLGKPVLVLRDTTERPEGIESGTLKIVGTDCENIYNETKKLLDDKNEYDKMSMAVNPYGDGHASEKIVDAIVAKFEEKSDN
jgi:UDP-N-acetylglucosamine 2-epimerase (non-hydrolysing)